MGGASSAGNSRHHHRCGKRSVLADIIPRVCSSFRVQVASCSCSSTLTVSKLYLRCARMKALHHSCSRRLFTSHFNTLSSVGSSSALFHSSSPLAKRKQPAPSSPEQDAASNSDNGATTPAAAASQRIRNIMVDSSISGEDLDVLSQSELAFGGSYDRSGHVLDMLKDGKVKPKPQDKKHSSKSKKPPALTKSKEPPAVTKAQKKKLRKKLKKQLLSEQLGDNLANKEKSASTQGKSQLEVDGSGTESGLRDSSMAWVETGRIRDNLGKDRAPHLPRTLLYTRRVEGIVPPLVKPVLEGDFLHIM